jgi:hypothetical protein
VLLAKAVDTLRHPISNLKRVANTPDTLEQICPRGCQEPLKNLHEGRPIIIPRGILSASPLREVKFQVKSKKQRIVLKAIRWIHLLIMLYPSKPPIAHLDLVKTVH